MSSYLHHFTRILLRYLETGGHRRREAAAEGAQRHPCRLRLYAGHQPRHCLLPPARVRKAEPWGLDHPERRQQYGGSGRGADGPRDGYQDHQRCALR
jgi:hypothetical protein